VKGHAPVGFGLQQKIRALPQKSSLNLNIKWEKMRKGFLLCCITLITCCLCLDATGQKIVPAGRPTLFHDPVAGVSRLWDQKPFSATVSPALYVERFGFFCRQEWKLEKASGVAFRFRLGSLDYVNRLEGKYRW
jgi:hypothetical protein